MAHYKITYRPLQGGWVVFDADRTTPQARMNGDSLPVVFAGSWATAFSAPPADKCQAWVAVHEAVPTLPLSVVRLNTGWWVEDARGRLITSTNTKAAAQALRRFILSEVGAMSLRQSQGVPA